MKYVDVFQTEAVVGCHPKRIVEHHKRNTCALSFGVHEENRLLIGIWRKVAANTVSNFYESFKKGSSVPASFVDICSTIWSISIKE